MIKNLLCKLRQLLGLREIVNMANSFTHLFTQRCVLPTGTLEDSGATTTADSETGVSTTVSANGGAANAVAIAFTSAGFQSMVLLATVNCVVTFTGATAIDGAAGSTVTLTANVMRRVTAVTGDVTAVSVGANTTGSGPAGTIQISVLFNS